MFNMSMFIYICFCCFILAAPIASLDSVKNNKCTENGECVDISEINVQNECDCNNDTNSEAIMSYKEMTDEFGNITDIVSSVDIKQLLLSLSEKHNTQDKIRKEIEQVFRGVIAAVILFGVCACVCVISACIYCCRINITDNRLKSDVEALAEKIKRDCRFKKSIKRTILEPVSESCNIIVGDAGVYVV